jgi:hypothetical protein
MELKTLFKKENAADPLSIRIGKKYLLHCEKSLFILASRQKIPAPRTEIPAVDTRTICLLPIEFF